MARGRRRFHLTLPRDTGWRSFWRRLIGERRSEALLPDGVDGGLRQRAAVLAMRAFIEGIENYELQTRRVVHVESRYVVPATPGLQSCVPAWLAERVRFGVVRGDGSIDHVPISLVDVRWDDAGTELLLHVEERIEPGTRAFVAAWLGDGASGTPNDLIAPPASGR
jgi:hypothetical protein